VLVVTVRFVLHPERLHEFTARVIENAKMSLEIEPDCLEFEVCADQERPEVFLYEKYTDAAAFQYHSALPHFKDFAESTNSMIAHREIKTYTPKFPVRTEEGPKIP
jgi:(4S)-4-hydroxy-5-phosphonooxypentane-2,3-dione isomerase